MSAGIADLTGISNLIVDPKISMSSAESSFAAFIDLVPYAPLVTTNTYDAYGNQLSSINADNEKTYATYSITYQHAYFTNITRVLTSSVNVTISYTYNFTTGMTLFIKDAMGNVTGYQYDSVDRITMVRRAPLSGVSSNMTFLFQDADNSFGIKNEKGNYTDIDYDGLNRVTQVSFYKGALYTSPVVSQRNATYNWQNQVKTVQDPTGNTTTYSYDYLGRLTKVTNPDGKTRVISYDDVNLVQSTLDENGHRTDNIYDSLHRLVGVREYYSPTGYYLTSYAYNGVGFLAKTTDAKTQITSYTFDDLNRPIISVFPDGFNETRSYDAVGNMITKKDPNGKTTTYGYDALNRLANVTYPDYTRTLYTYDKNGNRLTLSYLGNTASFAYNSRNWETSESWTIGGSEYTLSYTYDQVGNVASVTYPDSTKVNFSIDAMNRASTVKTGRITLATITYRPDSRIGNITYGNGVQTIYRYDNRGRPTEIKTTQGQTILMDLNYGYDGVGNVLSIGTESYSYDNLNHLTIGTGPWGTIKFGYDNVGNRLWMYQSPTNTTYVYGSYNRLTSSGSTTYGYDNNGNLRSQTTGSTTTNYYYDFEDRLTSVSQGSSVLGNYTYSPLGMRIQKIESGVTTTYVNSLSNVIYEKTGTTINDYVIANNLIIAKLTGGSTYYFHQDLLGSTRVVTTGSTTSFSSNYQPFGTQYGSTGTDPIFKYTGKPKDAASGLYYYAARYYDTGVGRFPTRDPSMDSKAQLTSCGSSCGTGCGGSCCANTSCRGSGNAPVSCGADLGNPQTLNRYIYVNDNPESYNDPTGLVGWFACMIAHAVCGLAIGAVIGCAVATWGVGFLACLALIFGVSTFGVFTVAAIGGVAVACVTSCCCFGYRPCCQAIGQ